MTPFQISTLLTAVVSIISGLFVFISNRKDRINHFWLLSSMAIGIWSLGLFGVVYSGNEYTAWLWQYVLDTGGIFIPVFYLSFIIYLLRLEKKYNKIKILTWTTGFALFLLSFTNLFKKGMIFKEGLNYWVNPGNLYFLFPSLFVLLVAISFYLLIKTYRETNDFVLKSQIKYLIVAQIVGFGGGITNFFPQLFNVYPFGNYLVALYIFFISYAVLKHQLFNVKVVATELLTFAIWIFVLIRLLLVDTLQEGLINGGLLVFLVIFGILLIRSVLKEVKTREELAVANEKLKELDKAKSEFVSIAAHELRTPVTGVKGYTSMILEGTFGQVPEKIKTALEKIFTASNRNIHLITTFLTVSRIERGKMEYVFEKADFKKIVTSVFDEFNVINGQEKKKLDLSLEIAENEDYTLNLDQERIREVIYNIVDNARKYTSKGFIKVSLCKNQDKSRVILKTQDSGAGLSKESLEKLFKKFSQTGSNQTVSLIGLGLGLFVAKEIIKVHGGEIRAESEGEGKGSTFYVELPYEK